MASKITRNFTAFLVILVFAAVICTSLGFVIYFMQNKSSTFGHDAMATSVLMCGLAFLLVACGFTFYYLINKYCMESRSKMKNFSQRKNNNRSKNS